MESYERDENFIIRTCESSVHCCCWGSSLCCEDEGGKQESWPTVVAIKPRNARDFCAVVCGRRKVGGRGKCILAFEVSLVLECVAGVLFYYL